MGNSIEFQPSLTPPQIAIHAGADHVIRQPDTSVAIIDTTGSFPLPAVRDVILEKISQTLTRDVGMPSEALQQNLAQCLARIEIMRCFDFVGLLEAIGEIRDKCEIRSKGPSEASSKEASNQTPPRMLIIDNVATVVQAELSKDQVEGTTRCTKSWQHVDMNRPCSSSILPTDPASDDATPCSLLFANQ